MISVSVNVPFASSSSTRTTMTRVRPSIVAVSAPPIHSESLSCRSKSSLMTSLSLVVLLPDHIISEGRAGRDNIAAGARRFEESRA